MGRFLAPRLVIDEVEELYDYEVLRGLREPTMLSVRVAEPTIVLGSSQSREVLGEAATGIALRRRRGGGGAVFIHPDDLWVDWWIPVNDPRWAFDVHQASALAGQWWRDALLEQGIVAEMHHGGVVDAADFRVACFSGRGPGELFVDDRKVLGVTQWRVREGHFLSTIVHAEPSLALVDVLASAPEGLAEALTHHGLITLGIDADAAVVALRQVSWPTDFRQLYLLP